jgi:hypothetical protein
VEEDKEKGEGDLHRQGRDLEMLQHAVDKSARERENMQGEMDMLLDRINKMSDMLDKSRVSGWRVAWLDARVACLDAKWMLGLPA